MQAEAAPVGSLGLETGTWGKPNLENLIWNLNLQKLASKLERAIGPDHDLPTTTCQP